MQLNIYNKANVLNYKAESVTYANVCNQCAAKKLLLLLDVANVATFA